MSKVYDQYRVNEDGDSWYLKISDGSVYGPETYAVMSRWVAEGRVAPEDEVSQDSESWMPAASVARFKMEWVAEFSDGSTYGPFNLLAVPNLLKTATFGPTTKLVNRVSGKSLRVDQVVKPGSATEVPAAPVARDVPLPAQPAAEEKPAVPPPTPVAESEKPARPATVAGQATDLSGPDFRQAVGDLESSVETLEGEKVRLETAAASFERERHEWERKVRVLESQAEKLTKKVAEKEEQYESQARWLIELREKGERKIKDLQESVDREKALRVALADKQGGDAAGKLADLNSHIEALRKKLSETEERLAREQAEGATLKKQWSETERDLQAQLKQLTADLDAAKTARGHAEKAASVPVQVGATAEQLAEFSAAQTRLRQIEQEHANAKEQLSRLEKDLASANRKYDEACRRAEEAEHAMHAFADNQKFSVKEAIEEALRVQESQKADLTSALEQNREQVKTAEVRLAGVLEELESLRAVSADAHTKCEAHQEVVKTKDAEHARQLGEQGERLREAESRLAGALEELEKLRAVSADAHTKCEAHQKVVRAKDAECSELLKNRTELEQTLGQIQVEWQTTLRKLETVEGALAASRDTESQLTSQLVESRAREEQVRASASQLQSTLTEQAEKLAVATAQSLALVQDAEQARMQSANMQVARDEAVAALQQTRTELSTVTRNLEMLTTDAAARTSELDALRHAMQQAESQRAQQIQALEAAAAERESTVARLTAEIAREREWRAGVEAAQAQTEASFRAEVESLQVELKAQLAEQKMTAAELANARQRMGELETQLSEQARNWTQQVDNLRTEVALHEGRVRDLNAELGLGQSLLEEVRRDKDEREKSLVHRIRELEDREKTSTAFLENATSEIRRIRQRCDAMETELQTLRDLEAARALQPVVEPLPVQIDIKPEPVPEPIPEPVVVAVPVAEPIPEAVALVDVAPVPDVIVAIPEPLPEPVPQPVSEPEKAEVVVETVAETPVQAQETPHAAPKAASTVTPPVQDTSPVEVAAEVAVVPVVVQSEEAKPVEVVEVVAVTEVVEDKKPEPVPPAAEPAPATQEWYLRLDDGSIYGPVPEEELKDWAKQCRIAPNHEVSLDQKLWKLAGALNQLEMDWLVVTPGGEQLGPFHRAAIGDLLAEGGVEPAALVRHRDGGQEKTVEEFCKTADDNAS